MSIGFKPKARIILQLGDQLIRSESIALLEIIKNAYDACATKVVIRMNNLDDPERGEIHIEDDGFGMDYKLIRDVWLHPGTTFKKNQIEKKGFESPCGRMPLGEKGIGRFGVHKLGERIELVSKKENSNEAYLNINWEDFDNDELLEKIPINLIERNPEVFEKNEHGTKIIIRGLRNKWTRGSIRELYRAITSLNSPFKKLDSFKVLFKIDRQDWLQGLLKFSDIKDNALFTAEATIENNEITSLEYEFTPWPTMTKIKTGRIHKEQGIVMSHKVYNEKEKKKVLKDIDISKFKIGTVKLKLLIFDLDTNILSLGVQDKKGFKGYLKSNGGIRVYRDDIRVYDYGEPGNDWLSLDLDRVNFPTARISNNIVIGSILLNRSESRDLIEKTNREGFIEDAAFWEFYSAIRFTLSRIITQRNIDKDKLRNHYGSSKTPVVDNLYILKEKLNNNLQEGPEKKEVLKIISEIEKDYKTITEIYIRSASAGLSLSIVIHEIEKIIKELLKVLDNVSGEDKDSNRVKSLVEHLGKLIDGYSGLVRQRSKGESDLVDIINDSIWNIEYRIKAHKLTVVKNYKLNKDFETVVKCSEGLITGSIINIIDNSIWWLNYGKVQVKKLYIDITDEMPGYITILIADNGPGFTLPTEEIIKPFISNKGGMGIGLHLAYEIMNGHDGELIFPDPYQFEIPREFQKGAIVGLAFKLKN